MFNIICKNKKADPKWEKLFNTPLKLLEFMMSEHEDTPVKRAESPYIDWYENDVSNNYRSFFF